MMSPNQSPVSRCVTVIQGRLSEALPLLQNQLLSERTDPLDILAWTGLHVARRALPSARPYLERELQGSHALQARLFLALEWLQERNLEKALEVLEPLEPSPTICARITAMCDPNPIDALNRLLDDLQDPVERAEVAADIAALQHPEIPESGALPS